VSGDENPIFSSLYIYKQGWKSIHNKYPRHVQANVNTPEENQNNQNSNSIEVKDLMLKGHPLPQIS
jgi:hypothetical protein